MSVELKNIDCLKYLKGLPDNAFELAIVDPPYGINVAQNKMFGKKVKGAKAKTKNYKKKDWDKSIPPPRFFKELFRVSKNQIIFGVNYFDAEGLTGGRIFWNKNTAAGYSSGDGELAYCSLLNSVKKVDLTWNGMIQHDMKNKEIRIHPTQKPVKLYEWLLTNYAKEGDKILDTHLGSGSIALACHNLGFDLVGCELDKDYYTAACNRLKQHKAQLRMF